MALSLVLLLAPHSLTPSLTKLNGWRRRCSALAMVDPTTRFAMNVMDKKIEYSSLGVYRVDSYECTGRYISETLFARGTYQYVANSFGAANTAI